MEMEIDFEGSTPLGSGTDRTGGISNADGAGTLAEDHVVRRDFALSPRVGKSRFRRLDYSMCGCSLTCAFDC